MFNICSQCEQEREEVEKCCCEEFNVGYSINNMRNVHRLFAVDFNEAVELFAEKINETFDNCLIDKKMEIVIFDTDLKRFKFEIGAIKNIHITVAELE